MRYLSRIFILVASLSLYGCLTISQVAIITPTTTIDVPETSTNIPTIQVTSTNTSTPTVIPTSTPLVYSTPFPLPSQVISTENIQDLQELAVFGKGKVNNFSYSPDGKLLAVATMRGIYIYDAFTFAEKKYMPTDDSVNSVAFSPDGAILAVTFARGSVQLWDVSSGVLVDTLEQNAGRAGGSVLFSPDGSFLFSGSGDAVIRMWQISDGKLIRTFRGGHEYYNYEMTNGMSISPDGSLLATTDGYEKVWIWRVSTGELLNRLDGHRVTFSPDGRMLAVGTGYYTKHLTVTFRQVSDWTLIDTFTTREGIGKILNMAFSPDGEEILVNDIWREAKLWNIQKRSVSECFQCGQGNFDILLYSPDGLTVATLDWDGVLQMWSMPGNELLHTFYEHMGIVTSIALSPDGNFLASNSPSSVGMWRLSDGTLLNLSNHKSYNTSFSHRMSFSPDSKLLAFGPYGGGLYLRDIDHQDPIIVINDNQTVYSMAFSSDGSILAVGFDFSRTVEFRKMPDGILLDTLELAGGGGPNSLAYSPDGEYLVICRYETVEIWRLSDKTLVNSFRRNGSMIDQILFSQDRDVFITGQSTARWSIDDKQPQILNLRGHAFSPNAELLLSIQGDKLYFFRMEDGKLIYTLRPNAFMHDAVFSNDGKLLAIAGDDGTVRIWGIP